MKNLKYFYTKGIQGISTHILKQFEHDNNLKKAIYQAMPILHNIKDNSLKLKNDFIQQDVLNFYDKIKHPDLMAVSKQIRKWGDTSNMVDNESLFN